MDRSKLLILLFLLTVTKLITSSKLGDFVSKYEIIELDVSVLMTEAYSYGTSNPVEGTQDRIRVRFRSFGDDIDFVAFRSTEHRAHGTKLEVRGLDGPDNVLTRDFDPRFYEVNREGLSAFGFLVDGEQFIGKVRSGNVTYYIEPAPMFFNDSTSEATAVVYRETDIKYPRFMKCGGHFLRVLSVPPTKSENQKMSGEHLRGPKNMDVVGSESEDVNAKMNVACEIELVGDMSLFKWWRYDYHKTAAFLYLHAKNSDKVFRETNLGSITVRIVVKRVVVFTSAGDPAYPFHPYTRDFEDYLYQFSDMVNNFCLSVCMCARRFDSPAIGLAFAAQYGKPYFGGICSPPTYSGSYRVKSSHNKAAITIVNRDSRAIPLGVTFRTFTHELGHSFGSRHDPLDNLTCAPGGKLGYYLMYELSQKSGILSGTFSPCSTRNMTRIVENRMKTCLVPVTPVCGNGIREEGEECDCGSREVCGEVDKCCTPVGGTHGNPECTYRRDLNYTCSPKENSCCTEGCVVNFAGRRCSVRASGCLVGYCDGTSKDCPRPSAAPDGTPCSWMSRTCLNGSCNSTVCLDNGLKDCTCDGEESCKVCCSDGTACLPTSRLNIGQQSDLSLQFGALCGPSHQCDVGGHCVYVGEQRVAVDNRKGWLHVVPYIALSIAGLIIVGTFAYLLFRHQSGRRNSRSSTRAHMPSIEVRYIS